MNREIFDNIKTIQKKMRSLNSNFSDDKEIRIRNGKLMLRTIGYLCYCCDPSHGYEYNYSDFLGSKYMGRNFLKKTIAAIICINNYLKNRQIYIYLSVHDTFVYRDGFIMRRCSDDCDDDDCDSCGIIGNFSSDNTIYNDTDDDDVDDTTYDYY